MEVSLWQLRLHMQPEDLRNWKNVSIMSYSGLIDFQIFIYDFVYVTK